MIVILKVIPTVLILFIISTCYSQERDLFKPDIIYESENLIITQISENAFIHTSYLKTTDFGNVPCNGLIVRSNNEAIIFDTPTNDRNSEELIKWLNEDLHSIINAIIPTHFHDDCLGGLKAFHNHKIPSYSYFKTLDFAKKNNTEIPQNSFKDSLVLKVGNEFVIAKYFGEGHTRDNIVGYFPFEGIIFGGCLIKERGANKGNLGDANVNDWAATVKKVKREYRHAKIIIPGHGKYGNKNLLDYTIKLFETK